MNCLENVVKNGLMAKKYGLFNSASLSIILAIEYCLIESLKPLGYDVYEENKNNKKYYHTLSDLTTKAFNNDLISQKMNDRLNALNILRRSFVHSKSGKTIENDVKTAFEILKQLLLELGSFEGQKSPLVDDLRININSIENNVKEQKNISFMGLVNATNEIGRSYSIDWSLNFALVTCNEDTLLVLAMITKYSPPDVEYLKKLLKPFNLSDGKINDVLRKLAILGALWIGHPHDRKVLDDPNLAPIEIVNDLKEELQKYFKANWPIMFKSFIDVEEDFDKLRKF